MIKVLIYSSKEIYEKAPFEGRAEARIIAYREGDYYIVLKNKTSQYIHDNKVMFNMMSRIISWAERDEWIAEKENYELVQSYKSHPLTELMKNDETIQPMPC